MKLLCFRMKKNPFYNRFYYQYVTAWAFMGTSLKNKRRLLKEVKYYHENWVSIDTINTWKYNSGQWWRCPYFRFFILATGSRPFVLKTHNCISNWTFYHSKKEDADRLKTT
jgi:nuclear transport factor 2 (NTF2) superfamily protein